MNETINWKELSEVEKLKYDSIYLRGTLVDGKSPGYYNFYLGGKFNGERLNSLYKS